MKPDRQTQSFAPQRILVTGGAGFIGSNFIRFLLESMPAGARPSLVVNLDKLTYAGNRASLAGLEKRPDYRFVEGDIADGRLLRRLLEENKIEAVFNFAAESHVDRSIEAPAAFIETNVVGTFRLLESALDYWGAKKRAEPGAFRFLHVSTDEVFGSLGPKDPAFTEQTPCQPRSPYAASKAASDHFARAYQHTFGLPVILTNCSNNYGPYQFPEKLIPLTLLNALEEKPLPVYGRGENVRDWLYVEDHCRGLWRALTAGRPGQSYNFGGNCEKTNLEVVEAICRILDEERPRPKGRPYFELKQFVDDRPGHDFRYAMNTDRAQKELGWKPQMDFFAGLRRTVQWYLKNGDWCKSVQRKGDERIRRGLKL